MQVFPDDPDYQRAAQREAEFWTRWNMISALDRSHNETTQRFVNATLTGRATMSWFADLIGRGPYRCAAMLGCTDGAYERDWLHANASRQLDIYELSPGVIRKAIERLKVRRYGLSWKNRRARFICVDLNFVHLPRDRYDVVWSSGCIHHLINLEYLFAEVERSLRPGGLFALQDYVGERRLQYSPERLRLVNEALREFPLRFRNGGVKTITPPPSTDLSPFEAIRSDEVLTVARARFDVVHLALAGTLFPLANFLDLHAMEREAPELVGRLLELESRARREYPSIPPSSAYAVFRKRDAEPTSSKN